MRRTTALALLAAAFLTVALAGCADSRSGLRPRGFTLAITNRWFPLEPGTVLTYAGVKDGRPQREVFTLTHRTKVVGGVRCVIVDDRSYSRGHLAERTSDYYAQDRRGNVWYFGEDTAELDAAGKVTSTEGTWHAGVDGARAGLFMPASPRLGEQHRQEYYKDHAEDEFRVADLRSRVRVPYGDFRDALRTTEWTRLESGVLDANYYVRGIGEVFEGSVKGPKEIARLIGVRRG